MGDESNDFHREVVRPKVTELLNADPTDYILDIACGNGNYSAYLAEKAVSVLAFDYSEKMVELAKKRQVKQGTLRFPCAGCRQLPFCGLAIWGHLALQAVPSRQVS